MYHKLSISIPISTEKCITRTHFFLYKKQYVVLEKWVVGDFVIAKKLLDGTTAIGLIQNATKETVMQVNTTMNAKEKTICILLETEHGAGMKNEALNVLYLQVTNYNDTQ